MEKKCKNCKHYSAGITDQQRKEWSNTNWGYWCTGICNLDFPRGYIARKAPHAAHATGSCFQFEEKE